MIPTFQQGQLGRGILSASSAADPYFANVVLLCHGNGTNGQTTFTDSSSSAKTLTRLGDAQVTTTDAKFGNGCILFDGTGDRVSAADSNDFRFGTGDFTIEAWVRLATTGAFRGIVRFEASGTSYHLRVTSGNALSWGTSADSITVGSLAANTWYHCAVARASGSLRVFLDGSSSTPLTFTTDLSGTSGTFYIGGNTFLWNGRLEEVRVTKGVARYTANFVPPTAPFPNA